MSLCVPLSQRLTPLFPALPVVPAALQPEATKALFNSRRHSMQTAAKYGRDMRLLLLNLILVHTLKTESDAESGMGPDLST